MKTVEFSLLARRDLDRMREWLEEHAPNAAEQAVDILVKASTSLANFPERGLRIRGGLRELIVPFGSAGYVLQYGVGPRRVIIARIFHTLEDR